MSAGSGVAKGPARCVDYVLEQTVPVGAGPHLHLGYVKETGEVWVSNTGEDAISLLDHADGRPLGRLVVGAGPAHFAFDAGCRIGFVALRDASEVVAVDPHKHEVLARVALPPGSAPVGTMPAFDRNRIYTLNAGTGTVSAIDTRTCQLAATIPVGPGPQWGQPWGASYKPITRPVGKSYIVSTETNDLTVFDDRTDAPIRRVAVGPRPVRNAIFREHDTIYTANDGDDTVSIVRIADDTVAATAPVLPGPFRLLPVQAITGRDEMWVLSAGRAGGHPGGVTVLDGTTHEVLRTITPVEYPANWVVSPTKLLFIAAAHARRMCVYDLLADGVADTVQLSHDPAPAAISGLIRTQAGTVFVLNADATVSLFRDRRDP